jgi:ABC-type multidrug transport system fused ATPase/permease subunit
MIIKEILKILSERSKKKYPKIIFFALFVSIFELISISLILPLIGITLDQNFIEKFNIEIINSLFIFLGTANFILLSIISFIFLILLKNLFIYLLNKKIFNFIYKVEGETSNSLLKEYLKRPYIFFINNNSSIIIHNLTQEIYKFNDLLLNSFLIISEIIIIFGIIALLMFVNKKITIFLIVIFLIIGFVYIKFYKIKTEKFGRELVGYEAKRIKILSEIFNSIKDLILYKNAKNFFVNSYKDNYKESIKIRSAQAILRNAPRILIETFVIVIICSVLFYSVFKNYNLFTFLPQIGLFIISALRLIPSFTRVAYSFQILSSGKETLSILNNEINETKALKNDYENIKVLKLYDEINLRKIRFKYDNSKLINFNINISIKKNSFTGVIGKSGTGKSTLIHILLGILPIYDGSIYVDKLEITNNESLLNGWRLNIGYVPQSIYLLDDTLKANIAFGINENEIDYEKLSAAIKLSKVYDFIKDWKNGYDTIIGEKGGKVSGGQIQRIGIARALYNNPDLIILDEATSSLDGNLEMEIIEILLDLKKYKTIIFVTHSRENMNKFDQIIDLDEIKINV